MVDLPVLFVFLSSFGGGLLVAGSSRADAGFPFLPGSSTCWLAPSLDPSPLDARSIEFGRSSPSSLPLPSPPLAPPSPPLPDPCRVCLSLSSLSTPGSSSACVGAAPEFPCGVEPSLTCAAAAGAPGSVFWLCGPSLFEALSVCVCPPPSLPSPLPPPLPPLALPAPLPFSDCAAGLPLPLPPSELPPLPPPCSSREPPTRPRRRCRRFPSPRWPRRPRSPARSRDRRSPRCRFPRACTRCRSRRRRCRAGRRNPCRRCRRRNPPRCRPRCRPLRGSASSPSCSRCIPAGA